MTTAISVSRLVKSFGVVRALDGLDLSVAPGEVYGFLGPNGSGKSTTIRVLLGLLRADAGEVTVLGGDPWQDAVALHRRLAYVPGDVSLWPKLSGGEIIDLFGRLRGDIDRARRAELLERFELDPTKKARTYSKGNRQKVALVAALASRAELLVLDEPTSGLDPLMEAVFQDTIREARAEGRTVLLSSHILAEVEALCDRVSIIRAGRTVQSGSLAEMRHLTRTTITAETARPPAGLEGLAGLHDLRVDGSRVSFDVDTDRLDDAVRRLSDLGLRSLTSHPPTLEELFLRHYGDEPAAGQAHDAGVPTGTGPTGAGVRAAREQGPGSPAAGAAGPDGAGPAPPGRRAGGASDDGDTGDTADTGDAADGGEAGEGVASAAGGGTADPEAGPAAGTGSAP